MNVVVYDCISGWNCCVCVWYDMSIVLYVLFWFCVVWLCMVVL